MTRSNRAIQSNLYRTVLWLSLACAGIFTTDNAANANTSATNSGLLISAPRLGSDSVTITATNTSEKNITFTAKISYTYQSLTGDRISNIKTVSETLAAGQTDAAVGTISERQIQVDKVTIVSAFTN